MADVVAGISTNDRVLDVVLVTRLWEVGSGNWEYEDKCTPDHIEELHRILIKALDQKAQRAQETAAAVIEKHTAHT